MIHRYHREFRISPFLLFEFSIDDVPKYVFYFFLRFLEQPLSPINPLVKLFHALFCLVYYSSLLSLLSLITLPVSLLFMYHQVIGIKCLIFSTIFSLRLRYFRRMFSLANKMKIKDNFEIEPLRIVLFRAKKYLVASS